MDLYSDTIELLKGEIDWFYNITVPLYNSAHKHAVKTVKSHHASQHDDASPSNVNHTVPDLEEKTCRDDLPEFNCLGSSSCSDTFSTPSEAYNTHRELCGSEEVHRNSPVPGDGIFYYTCNADGVARHGVRNCQKWFWYNDVRETRCNLPYRVCTNPEFSHRNAWWSSSTTHESRAEEISDYFEVVGSHLNDPVDPYGTYRAAHLGDPSPTPITETDNSPNCDYCTTGGCSACPITYACGNHSGPPSESNSHSMQASCLVSVTQDGGLAYCTVTSFYACQTHTHQFPPARQTEVCSGCNNYYDPDDADEVAQHQFVGCLNFFCNEKLHNDGKVQSYRRCSNPASCYTINGVWRKHRLGD